MQGFGERAGEYRQRVEKLMTAFVAERTADTRLGRAIAYAVAGRGKRIRPLLSYAAAETLGLPVTRADYPAAAVELVHTYSLVHDDLPAMDDDDFRRGRPTVHKQFDEATGILVGDALLTYAFELLASAPVDPALALHWVRQLSAAAGGLGMIAGQGTDLEGEERSLSLDELALMHRRKSGALIGVSLAMVAAAGEDADTAAGLSGFAHHIGLAFQIRDDILDVAADKAQQRPGPEAPGGKSTFVSLLGPDGARQRMAEEAGAAESRLDRIDGDTEGLRWIARYVVTREY